MKTSNRIKKKKKKKELKNNVPLDFPGYLGPAGKHGLDSGLDSGLDPGLDSGLDSGLDYDLFLI